jgi:chromosome segregation ATPase
MASQEVLKELENLHQELEKLKPAIKHVEAAQQVTEVVKGIPQKHLDLLKEVKDSDIKHKNELKELFSGDLKLITEEYRKLSKTTGEIQDQVKYEQKYLAELREAAKELYKKIEDVHFPERLDKLDANVAGIMSGIQAVQNRLENLERNIIDKLSDVKNKQEEAAIISHKLIIGMKKRNLLTSSITIGLTLIIIVLIIYQKI